MPPMPPVLMDELVEEVLLRLPPEDPASFVRSSAACKPWRRILAAPRFRRRYREFHGTPPVLGFFKEDARFVPTTSTSTFLPVQPRLPSIYSMDSRHGRALFADFRGEDSAELVVLEPITGHQRRVPLPDLLASNFSAAVLCTAQGCDHHGCQGGHSLVAFVSTDEDRRVTSACLCSPETGAWSRSTILNHPNVESDGATGVLSVLVGDALYFNIGGILKYQLGTRCLSIFGKPINSQGCLMTAGNGELGFAAVVDDATNLTLWSMETGSEGAMGWEKRWVIDLQTLLPDGALLIRLLEREISCSSSTVVSGFAEGTQVIFVSTFVGCYMVDLKSGRARKVSSYSETLYPYTSFYIPAMEVASTGQGQ
uniref:Uncharacterized protein n=1 Tax=Avena sativa TaxID=4498 RepID=A0ACD6A915_AVESA